MTNSVGGVAALQAAASVPEAVRGIVLLDVSLRALHVSKQAPPLRPLVAAFRVADPPSHSRPLSKSFARGPNTVRMRILRGVNAGAQRLLRQTPVGLAFFSQVATPNAVRRRACAPHPTSQLSP